MRLRSGEWRPDRLLELEPGKGSADRDAKDDQLVMVDASDVASELAE